MLYQVSRHDMVNSNKPTNQLTNQPTNQPPHILLGHPKKSHHSQDDEVPSSSLGMGDGFGHRHAMKNQMMRGI